MGNERTWRELIREKLGLHGETWKDVEASTLTETELDRPLPYNPPYKKIIYDDDQAPFLLWTATRVYFSKEYDGTLSIGNVRRHPGEPPEDHI